MPQSITDQQLITLRNELQAALATAGEVLKVDHEDNDASSGPTEGQRVDLEHIREQLGHLITVNMHNIDTKQRGRHAEMQTAHDSGLDAKP